MTHVPRKTYDRLTVSEMTRFGAVKLKLASFFDKPWKVPLVFFLAIVTIGIPRLAGPLAKDAFQFGIDLQEYKCLPYTFYWFNSGRVGDVPNDTRKIVLKHNQLVSFIPHDNMMGRTDLDGLRIVKIVAGLPGDIFEVKNNEAYINGEKWGDLTLLKTLNKPSGYFDRRIVIPEGRVLLLGTTQFSYDGRYYGLIDQHEINATVYPIF